MKASWIALLCFALLGLLSLSQTSAKEARKLRTEDGSGVGIEVSSDFDNGVPSGAEPLHITVHNNTGRPGTWLFEVNSNPFGEGIRSTVRISLGAGQSRTVPFAAPLQRFHNLTVRASGPGTTGDTERFSYQSNGHGSSGETQFLAMSRELSSRSWEPLKKELEKGKKNFSAAQFDPVDLAPDWRGFSGVEWLSITREEWDKLDPAVRAAIRQWVGQGGHLAMAVREGASFPWNEFHLPSGGSRYGFGDIRAIPWDGKELSATVLAPLITKNSPLFERLNQPEGKNWSMRAALGDLKPNVPLIVSFVIGFAVLVGPANLFIFAPAVRRHRMFWTTPLISLGGGLALIGVILLQEGTGGTGRRYTLVNLLPETHEAVVWQDQVARTGLLLGSGFQLCEEALVHPIPLDGNSGRSGRMNVEGMRYSGDWFRSRSIQAQHLAAIRPTRAAVTVTGTEASGAPIVVSSIGSPLKALFLTDENGKSWGAKIVRTGEKTVLQPSSGKDIGFPQDIASPARSTVDEILKDRVAHPLPGTFVAAAADPMTEPMATLHSIRWKDDCVVYLGPVVNASKIQTEGMQP
ncbi:MAG: hypothetical protein ACFUZC_12105 [Chthoniobacteraceae bacterium]